jgi:predicted Zn-dependent protease
MKKIIFLLSFCCIALLPINIYAQCNPNDTVESWYGWFKGYENWALDYVPISEADEMIVGDSVHLEMTKEFKLVRGYEKQAYLENIVRKLTQHVERKGIKYTIHVIDDKRTLNAFAVAGGHVYVTTKMVEWTESEDELAFVLGHEIAHADHKHGIRKVQKMMLGQTFGGDYGKMAAQIENVLTAPFGQIDEYEADREGAILANKAGYNPRKGLRFFEKMGEKENYSIYEKVVRTHPYSAERMKCLDSFLREELNK